MDPPRTRLGDEVVPAAAASAGTGSSPSPFPRPKPSRRQNRPRVADDARRRATRACKNCRRLKEKCNGREPCERCIKSRRQCQYGAVATSPSVPGPAGTAAPAGAPGTEAAPDASEAERVHCLERLVTHFLGSVPLDLTNLRRVTERLDNGPFLNNDDDAADGDWEDLEGLTLEDESFTVKTLSPSTAHYSGEFSHWNFSQKVQRRLDEYLDGDQASVPLPRVQNPALDLRASFQPAAGNAKVLEYWRATQLQSPNTHVLDALHVLPPRKVADFLAQMYFQYAQVNSFVAEEGWVREKLDIVYRGSSIITSADAAWVASIIMILATGTQFAHMATGPPLDPSPLGEENYNDPPSEPDVSLTFYHVAAKLIPDIIAIASLDSVQACLLLAYYVLPLDAHGLAYTYLGLAVKMAIQNGMHRRYTGADLDPQTVETRNRLWWSAYTWEKRISVLHGRPGSIATTEVDVDLPKDLPGFRQYDQPSKFPNMSAQIYVTQRLGDISNAMTLLRRCPKTLQTTYFERVLDVSRTLQTWWSTLPRDVRIPNPAAPLFRSNAHLKLCFHTNEIFLGRPFVFHDAKQASPRTINSSSGDQPSPSHRMNGRATLVSGAVAAAFEIVELLGLMRETTGLARASYIEFSSGRAALLVMLAESLKEQRSERLGAMIALGMGLIKHMARNNNVSARSEASVIVALELAVRRLYSSKKEHGRAGGGGNDFSSPAASGDGGDAADVQKTGYDRFREWATLCRGAAADMLPTAAEETSFIDPMMNVPPPLAYGGGGGGGEMNMAAWQSTAAAVPPELADWGCWNGGLDFDMNMADVLDMYPREGGGGDAPAPPLGMMDFLG